MLISYILMTNQILQFKISLKHSKPSIWRRVQIPSDSTFEDLHLIIQIAMGWCDEHLHDFCIKLDKNSEPLIFGIPSEDGFGTLETKAEWDHQVIDFLAPKQKMIYTYDFGDNWEHEILFEKIIDPKPNQIYPVCTDGKCACPPEDIGGVWGYEHFLEAIKDPAHEEHEEMLEWVHDEFDPDAFDPKEVVFD